MRYFHTIKIIIASLILGWVLPAQALTQPLTEGEAKSFITDVGASLSQLVQKQHASEEAYYEEMRQLLKAKLDLPVIGQFLLGVHGRGLDKRLHDRFTAVLEDYIVLVYGVRLKDYYGGEPLIIDNITEQSGTYLVQSHLGDDESVSVAWRLYRSPEGDIKVIDVMFNGISMMVSQRDEFAAIIRNNNNDVNILIEKLQDQIRQANQ